MQFSITLSAAGGLLNLSPTTIGEVYVFIQHLIYLSSIGHLHSFIVPLPLLRFGSPIPCTRWGNKAILKDLLEHIWPLTPKRGSTPGIHTFWWWWYLFCTRSTCWVGFLLRQFIRHVFYSHWLKNPTCLSFNKCVLWQKNVNLENNNNTEWIVNSLACCVCVCVN